MLEGSGEPVGAIILNGDTWSYYLASRGEKYIY